MRASPAFQITLEHFGAWRVAILAAMGLATAALAAWWLTDHPERPRTVAAALTMICAGALSACATLWRCPLTRLRWDGQCWHVASCDGGDEVPARRLDVAVDLGVWMLLRLDQDTSAGGRRIRWLPAQRRGHVAHWHALRCAVYSARPAAGPDAGAHRAISQNQNNERP